MFQSKRTRVRYRVPWFFCILQTTIIVARSWRLDVLAVPSRLASNSTVIDNRSGALLAATRRGKPVDSRMSWSEPLHTVWAGVARTPSVRGEALSAHLGCGVERRSHIEVAQSETLATVQALREEYDTSFKAARYRYDRARARASAERNIRGDVRLTGNRRGHRNPG
jgi:hypothetical protein